MGVLEDKTAKFLDVGGSGNGGYGYGFGNGYGCGNGGNGGNGGYGYGYGYGYGSGNGGSGNGGYGGGNGGSGNGGNGGGNGGGSGGDGSGVKSIDGHTLYDIDNIPTAITSLHGNYAKGFTLRSNVIKQPCYIAKVGNYFAHGSTLKEAMADAQTKYEQNRPLSGRIADFKSEYPTLDTEAEASDLFRWHNILTGSCLYGRKEFCEQHGVDYEKGKWKIRDFFELCKDAFGSDAIRQAIKAYDKEN